MVGLELSDKQAYALFNLLNSINWIDIEASEISLREIHYEHLRTAFEKLVAELDNLQRIQDMAKESK